MQPIKNLIRKFIPKKLLKSAENTYRQSRAFATAAVFGLPARKLHVIAVTGTNGKTTTASYINSILKAGGKKTALFSTAWIEIVGRGHVNDLNRTVPTAWYLQKFMRDAVNAGAEFVIIEATSHAIHQKKLAFIPVETAVMTNLTQDHLDYHKTMEAYAEVKSRLFANHPKYIVLNADDSWYEYFNKFEARGQKVTYGESKSADYQIKGYKTIAGKGSNFKIASGTDELEIVSHLPGKFNAYNFAAATAVAKFYGVDNKAIVDGANDVKSVAGRFEKVKGTKCSVIVDYAHTPDALEKTLQAVREQTKGRVILVFGACGDRDKTKRPIMGEIAAKEADLIYLTDEENYTEDAAKIREMIMQGIIKAKGTAKTYEIADRKQALIEALAEAKPSDVILVTGLGHEQYRIIDGKRVRWNDTEVIEGLVK